MASRLLGVPAFAEGRDVASLLGLELQAVLAMTRRAGLQAIRLPNGLGVWGQANLLAQDGIRFGHALRYAASSAPVVESTPAAAEALVEPAQENALVKAATPHSAVTEGPIKARLSDHHHQLIDSALAACGGNISHAARTLGVSRGVLYRHLRTQSALAQKSTAPPD